MGPSAVPVALSAGEACSRVRLATAHVYDPDWLCRRYGRSMAESDLMGLLSAIAADDLESVDRLVGQRPSS